MYCYRHLTKKRQKDEDLPSMFSQLRSRSKKNRKKEELIQNKCVSSQKSRIKKRRGRHRSGVSPTFLQLAVRLSFVGQNGQIRNPNHREILIKYQKRPTIVSSRRPSFQNSTDWLSKQMKQMKQKKCSWVWEQTKKHENVIKWHKTTVHSLFLGCVYTQKIYSIPRVAMLLLGSLWL